MYNNNDNFINMESKNIRQMEVKVNILELASELAHNRLVRESDDVNKIYKTDEIGTLTYTEDAQDLFDRYYDHYYDVIWECKVTDILI